MVILNVFGTPVYMFAIFENTCNINTRRIKTVFLVLIYIFGFPWLYIFLPYIIAVVIIPYIIIFTAKKGAELG